MHENNFHYLITHTQRIQANVHTTRKHTAPSISDRSKVQNYCRPFTSTLKTRSDDRYPDDPTIARACTYPDDPKESLTHRLV